MNKKINDILRTLNYFSDVAIRHIVNATQSIEVTQDGKNITIFINLNSALSTGALQQIYKFNANNRQIKLLPKPSSNILSSSLIHNYIYGYLLSKKIDKLCAIWKLINLTLDKNVISIYYHNEFQFHELDSIKYDLLNYLNNNLYLGIDNINLLLDHNIQTPNSNKETIELNYDPNFVANKSNYDYKKLDLDGPITKINDIDISIGEVIIECEIFNIKFKKFRSTVNLIEFYVHDDNGSIIVKKICNNTEQFADLQIGTRVRMLINLELSKSSFNAGEICGNLKKYKILDLQTSENNSTNQVDEPRVELSVHTKMSSYDGIIDLNDLKKFLEKNNYKYFAITDRYNVQNYPDVYKKFLNSNISPIYGVEMEVLPDEIPAVLNPINDKLEDVSFTVFDLETTGLHPKFDDIIEFGAVRIKGGVVKESIQFFIKPTFKISDKITEITKITNDDLENACDQKTGLEKIIEFIKDDVLVAHNGIDFDFNFLNTKLEQYGFKKIQNCMIDTLYLSRALNPNYKSHSLEVLTRKLKIEYNKEQAHRADYDAKLLSNVFLLMIRDLVELECFAISDINPYINSKCDKLRNHTRGYFVTLYAKNQNAIRDIYELVSLSHSKHFSGRPVITWTVLNQFRKNLLITNLCIEGDVISCAINKNKTDLVNVIEKYDFITICPVSGYLHEIQSNNITSENYIQAIKEIITISNEQNKIVCAASNAYYLTKNDKQYHDLYISVPTLNKRPHRFSRYSVGPDTHYRTTSEMLCEFGFLNNPELAHALVIDNPNAVASLIEFPIKPIKDKLYPPVIDGVNDKVKEEVYRNAYKMYGSNLPEVVKTRIEKELTSIITNGYAVVYWISHLLVKESTNDGYVVGSRGSVGSSIVATFLNITDVNPLPPHYLCLNCTYSDFDVPNEIEDGYDLPPKMCPKCNKMMQGDGHDILFEVFLGFYGDKVPDIDLNFSGDYQYKAHNFIKSMFGEKHTYRAGTISTIADKTAYSNAKIYFENINKKQTQSELERYVSKCVDVKRTTGQHPGGIIVVPNHMSIYDFTPYNYPADDTKQDWFTTHFAFEHIHDNLLKFDILGHDNPTILKILKDLTGVDEKDIPHYDPKTMSLFNSVAELKIDPSEILGEQTGAFSLPEFGTKFVRQMLNDTRPNTFADLIRISGLSHGTDVWVGNAKSLISRGLTLKEIIACRDDIMSYLINHKIDAKIAFNVMEDVRKGKQIKPEYIQNLLEANVPQWYIDSCNKIKYMFPKAHATAYVMHAWKFAWYKLNYPLEYYAAYFSIRSDVFNIEIMCQPVEIIKQKYDLINQLIRAKSAVSTKDKDLLPLYEIAIEMHARGIKFKTIDIYNSDAKMFVIDRANNSLICPFSALDGLGDSVSDAIIKERNNKQFGSEKDFLSRTKISSKIVKKMEELKILSGVDDSNQLNLFDINF